jgi:hypothetical protein
MAEEIANRRCHRRPRRRRRPRSTNYGLQHDRRSRGERSLSNASVKDQKYLTYPTKEESTNVLPPRWRVKRLLQRLPKKVPKLPLPLEKRRRKLTLDDALEAIVRKNKLEDVHLKLYKNLPPRGRAPLHTPSPRGTPKGKGPTD